MSEAPWVELREVAFDHGPRRVLGPLSLSLERGETLVLLGPNGAGKTTLLRLLVGLSEPSGGSIFYDGVERKRLSRRALARRIAYVPQIRPARIPLTVEEVVFQGRYPHLQGWRQTLTQGDYDASTAAMERVGILHLRQRRLDELSGGERQAVFIGAALAQEGEILVLDEPTTHLDPRHQTEVTRLLLSLQRQGDLTLVAATHDLAFTSHLAHRVCGLKEGRRLGLGPTAELLQPLWLQSLFEIPFLETGSGGVPRPRVELGP
jgi:iron complex transport system ATP-binding protein